MPANHDNVPTDYVLYFAYAFPVRYDLPPTILKEDDCIKTLSNLL